MERQDQVTELRRIWDKNSQSFVAEPDSRLQTHKPRTAERFLKGPVPWNWIVRASQLPGKALVIGLCLWRLKGVTGKVSITLSNSELQPFGVDRAAKSRGLAMLETAGLVTIDRKRGRWPTVTLIS